MFDGQTTEYIQNIKNVIHMHLLLAFIDSNALIDYEFYSFAQL